MKKIFTFIATLTLSAGMWAQTYDNIEYIDANGVEQTANGVTEITPTTPTTLNAGWYVVKGADVQTSTLVCNGAVHLILTDGTTLTATGSDNQPGIQVSGGGNSLTIYCQTAQSGRLIATGGKNSAGIGGGDYFPGSNITINGGKITANGGSLAAGIGGGKNTNGSNITINGGKVTANGGSGGPGIGGGEYGSGSNITINGGEVTANGGSLAPGIGGGEYGSGSNITINGGEVTANGDGQVAGIGGGYFVGSGSDIFVATNCIVKADNSNPPTTVIAPTRTDETDLASDLAGKQYVTVKLDLTLYKIAAIAEIDVAIEGVTDETIIAIATDAKTRINAATTVDDVNSIKIQALADIALVKAKIAAITEINDAVTDTDILAIATAAIANINAATTEADVNSIKTQALADIALAKTKIAAITEINDAIKDVTDKYITDIAAEAKTNITNAETTAAINAIKTLPLAKINAIKEINDATKDLTLFSAEVSYINLIIKSSIQQDDDANLINGDKQLGLDYIALHDDKLAAIAAVKHDMGDYAESEAIYNFIGGPAIEGAVDAVEITEAKNAAIAKLEEFSTILGDAATAGYNKGKEDGIEEVLGAMGEPCDDCTAVEVTDGTTTVTLYNPKNVQFKKIQQQK